MFFNISVVGITEHMSILRHHLKITVQVANHHVITVIYIRTIKIGSGVEAEKR